jgi:hypothetical protein
MRSRVSYYNFLITRYMFKHAFWCVFYIVLLMLNSEVKQFINGQSMTKNSAVRRMRGTYNKPQPKSLVAPNSNEILIKELHPQEPRRAADLNSTLNNLSNTQGLYNNLTKSLATAQNLYNNATSIYNKSKSTINDTAGTPPNQWTKNQWIFVGIALAVLLCCFGCIWKCIPCTPRII